MEADKLDPRLIDCPPWIVRVRNAEGGVSGAGFLIDPTHVLTCAHVVSAALSGTTSTPTRAPTRPVTLDFPNLARRAPATRRKGRLAADRWFPIKKDETADVAILELDSPVDPLEVPPAPLRRPARLYGRPFFVRGYPTGPLGVHATGVIRDAGGPSGEWVQIEDVKVAGAPIGAGFSGGPIFATDIQAVVGMVVASDHGAPGAKIANMISLETVARLWPPLEGLIRWRADLDRDFRVHWLPRARGVEPEAESVGWYFTGRHKALEDLSLWLADESSNDHRMRVVTGAPGTGKSAILAHLLLRADPLLCDLANSQCDGSVAVPVGSIDLAIHAKGRSLQYVLETICDAAGVEASTPDALIVALQRRAKPFTLLVDALDEAVRTDVYQIANTLSRLALDRDSLGIRVLVGVRDGLDAGAVAEVRRGLGSDIVKLKIDRPPYMEERDLEDYAARRLLLNESPTTSTPYRGQEGLARIIAHEIGRRATPLFLVAQLTTMHLTLRASMLPIEEADWAEGLPSDIGSAVDLLLKDLPGNGRPTRDLLTALSYAEGDGFTAATWAAVAGQMSGRPYSGEHVADVIESAAAFLVSQVGLHRSSSESTVPSYRLFHQALDDHFRRSRDELNSESQVLDVLLSVAPRTEAGYIEWDSVDSYCRQHSAAHAALAGRLDELLEDPGFLVAADVTKLVPVLGRARSVAAQRAATLIEINGADLRGLVGEERASRMALSARKLGLTAVADSIDARYPSRAWRAAETRWRSIKRHVVLAGHAGAVLAIALGRVDGHLVAVSGGDDHTVRLWDLEKRSAVGEPMLGHGGWVRAVAVGLSDQRPLAITGSSDGTLRTWDLESQVCEGPPFTGHVGWVRAVALGTLNGRGIAVSGGCDGTVRVWDLATRTQVGDPMTDDGGWVNALSIGTLNDHPVVVSGGDDGCLRVWDLESRSLAMKPLVGHQSSIHALAVGMIGWRTMAVSGGHDGKIQIWDLQDGQTTGNPLQTHEGWVRALSIGTFGGRPLAASGGNDDSIQIHDVHGLSIREELAGHRGSVYAVALGDLGSEALVVSGGSDGTVRMWMLPVSAPRLSETQLNSVNTMAVDSSGSVHPVVVTGGQDGVVRVWKTPSLRAGPHYPHSASVTGVTAIRVRDRLLVASGHRDGVLRLWDPDGQDHPKVISDEDGPISAVAAALVVDRPMLVSVASSATRLWDLRTRVSRKLPCKLPNAICLKSIGDRLYLITGDDDAAVRFWDLSTGSPRGEVLLRHGKPVRAVAAEAVRGEICVVSGDGGGQLAFHNNAGPTTYRQANAGPIDAIGIGAYGGLVLAATGGAEGVLKLWSLEERTQLGEAFLGSAVRAVAFHQERVLVSCAAGLVSLDFNLRPPGTE